MRAARSAAVILALFVSACASPTGPSPSGPTVVAPAGTWGGFFRIDSCTPSCDAPVGTQYAFLLEIVNEGADVRATLTSELPEAITASFQGTLRDDGVLALTQTSAVGASDVAFSQVLIEREGDGITGTLTYTNGPREIAASIPSAAGVTAPSPPTGSALDLVGSWAGKYRADSCTGPQCMTVYPRDNESYDLRIIREGDALLGLLRLEHRVFSLTGTARPDGSVEFVGGPPDPLSPTAYDLEMRRFVLRRDAAAGLTGTIHYRFVTEEGPTNERATIVNGVRREIAERPGFFQGVWNGGTLVRGCRGDCRDITAGGEYHPIRLRLSERDGVITGDSYDYGGFAVSGTSSGATIRLAGARTPPSCPPDWEGYYCSVTLRDFRASIDELGQMRGTFYLDLVYMSLREWRLTLRLELVDMTRASTLLK